MGNSVFKKIKSIANNGIEPIIQGKSNYKLNDKAIELKAIKRAEICFNCVNFVAEPIKSFKVEDKRIKELTGKMCDDCGCALPYLLRQKIKICKHWKK